MNFRDEGERKKPIAMFSHSSLTDIVLLLLIFFLLTSSFVTNFGIKVNIPKAESGSVTESQYVTVALSNDNQFYVGGDLVANADLATAIRQEHQQHPERALVLRADKEARVDDAVRVMNIAKALNMRIIMATERGLR